MLIQMGTWQEFGIMNGVGTYHEVPLSMGFSKQEYWCGLTCPLPGDLPDPGIEPAPLRSPALADRFFTTSTTLIGITLNLKIALGSIAILTI